ncbi:MAG: hypothetical protein ACOX8B_03535 [Lachnospiraceae bacterium]
MYPMVSKQELKPYRMFCSDFLTDLCRSLHKKYGITATFLAVGSGMWNMVSRDSSGGFDLDYNLILHRIPEPYASGDLLTLKNQIRSLADGILHRKPGLSFSYGKDSTSSLTYYLRNPKDGPFHIDLGILWERGGKYYRLIHDKRLSRAIWNEAPDLSQTKARVQAINRRGLSDKLREEFLSQKAREAGTDKLSYVIFTEAVNRVYQKI